MRFHKVRMEAIATHLPERVVTSQQLEQRLAPVYERLRLSEGRLELMSGIRERLELADVPEAMEGLPIAFITASLMGLAFMGFLGIKI